MQQRTKHMNQHQNTDIGGLSPSAIKFKPKKTKETGSKLHKVHHQTHTTMTSKRHLQSKSALQPTGHVQFNIAGSIHSKHVQNKNTSPYTFTEILKHSHSHHPPYHSTLAPQLGLNNQQLIEEKQNRNRDHHIAQSGGSTYQFNPNVVSIYTEKEAVVSQMEFGNALRQKLSNIRSENSISCQKSVQKSNSKSPYRVTNVHRLNNTPKIKNKKNQKESHRKEIKTFTQALVTKNEDKSRESIKITKKQEKKGMTKKKSSEMQLNLECSQKIFKFMRESQQKPKKNKSNLLSTGILNMSQPFQNSQSRLNTLHRLSKQTLPSKVNINRIISEQSIKQFQSQTNPQSLANKIQQVKQKLEQSSSGIQHYLQRYNSQTFFDQITASFNPELLEQDISQTVQTLTELNNSFQTVLQSMIKQLSAASQRIHEDITSYIELVNTSKSTMVDWLRVEQVVEDKQKMESWLWKNQVRSIKISDIQNNLEKHYKEKSQNFNQIQQKSSIINGIDRQLSEEFHQLSKVIQKNTIQNSSIKLIPDLTQKLSQLVKFQQQFNLYMEK